MSKTTLRVGLNIASGEQRDAWRWILNSMRARINDYSIISIESQKRMHSDRLKTDDSDVAYWYAGERLRSAARNGLILPFDNPALLQVLKMQFSSNLLAPATLDGKIYGLPFTYYPWGFLYRRSMFARWGVAPPETWTEFLGLCDHLKGLGIAPTALGARDGFSAAGWFDYLSLRFNGLDEHRRVLRGDASFQSPAAQLTFRVWRALLRNKYFLPETIADSWASVLPYLSRGLIGMTLAGSYAALRMPRDIRNDLGFFGFPKTKLPNIVDMPVDALVVPATSPRKIEAQHFLTALASGDELNHFAMAAGALSPKLNAPMPNSDFMVDVQRIAKKADDINLFFDREVRESMIEPAFDVFREFLQPPYDGV